MSIVITLIAALVAAIILTAAYPRPIAYPAAVATAAGLLVISGLLVRDYAQYRAAVLAAVVVLALAMALTGWAIAEALAYADRKRDEQQRPAVPPRRPVLAEQRHDLDGHTITIEDGPAGRTVVERSDGLLIKIVRTSGGLAYGETLPMVARAAAGAYAARYVPDLAVDNILGGAR